MIRTTVAIRRVSMPRHDGLHAHVRGALHDPVKVVDLEPQQYTVSVRPVIAVADRTMMVVDIEAVQLKDELAIRSQTLILGTAMITPAAKQTLVPLAACFHIGDSDERLRAHLHKASNSLSLAHGCNKQRFNGD
jgi:hypothetical protein